MASVALQMCKSSCSFHTLLPDMHPPRRTGGAGPFHSTPHLTPAGYLAGRRSSWTAHFCVERGRAPPAYSAATISGRQEGSGPSAAVERRRVLPSGGRTPGAEPGAHSQVAHGRERARGVATKGVAEWAAAVATIAVAGAGLAVTSRGKVAEGLGLDKPVCTYCDGTGICKACRGEGFRPKELTAEEAARARAGASNAATRYTAGLAKKWSYCSACNGGRGCPYCEGRGYASNT